MSNLSSTRINLVENTHRQPKRTANFRSNSSFKDLMPPRGFQHPACLTLAEAVYRVLDRLYDGILLPSTLQPNKPPKQSERNAEIRKRYAAAESLLDLANAYGLSKQRIHQVATASETID